VKLVPTQRITDNDWTVNADGAPIKPIFGLDRMAPEMTPIDMSNSDRARETLEFGLQWEARFGYGVFLPYGIMKVDN